MNFSFCLARHGGKCPCCFLSFNSSLYRQSYSLSILTNAVMIRIVINTVNQIPPLPPCRTADQPKSHEVSSFPSACRQCRGHEFCLTTKWFTKLNTMKVKTCIIIGPNNYSWHPLLSFLWTSHSFMRTRDIKQQDQATKKGLTSGIILIHELI